MRSHFPRTKWPICSTPWMQNVGKDVKQPELADCQRMRALSAKWNTLLLPTRRLIHGSYSLSLTYSWVFYTLWWAWEEQPLFSRFSLLWRKESFVLGSQFRVQSVLWGRHCVGEWDLGLSCLTSGNRGRWILFLAPTLFTQTHSPREDATHTQGDSSFPIRLSGITLRGTHRNVFPWWFSTLFN